VSLWTPPKASKEHVENSIEFEVKVYASLDDTRLPEWDRELKKIDDRLSVRRARVPVRTGSALRPGYWHLIRDNSDKNAPVSVTTIQGPEGEYIEPNSSLLEMVRRNDLWRPGAIREREEYAAKLEAEEEKRKEEELEEVTQEAIERFQAGNRAFVSMDRSVPWTQSARARRQ
jgi:hypothetical protein